MVVEDNSITAKALKNNLQRAGYNVFLANSADAALKYLRTHVFDLMITDINLGDAFIDGIDLVKKLNKTKNTPVIYLTAYGDDITLEDIAQTNHSYYLTKPYDNESLLKTIKLTMYKYKMNNIEKVYLSQNIIYEVCNKVLYHDGKEIKLTAKENLFLTLLVHRKNQIVSTEEIIEHVWQGESVLQGNMHQLISRAREKLTLLTIETHHGEGYRLRIE